MVEKLCVLHFEWLDEIWKGLTLGISRQVKIVMLFGEFMFIDSRHHKTTVSVILNIPQKVKI